MDVATTLAVSWKPFVKSKASAVATTITTMTSESTRLGVLERYALDDVGHLLGRVDGVLELLEDVLPADHDHWVDPVVEQRGHRLADDPVAVVLEPVDLHGVVGDVPEATEPWQRL